MRTTVIGACAFLLLCIAALLVVVTRGGDSSLANDPAADRSILVAEPDFVETLQGTPAAPELNIAQSSQYVDAQREAVATVLTAKLVTKDGQPIAGAEMTWTTFTVADAEWEPSWQDDDWGAVDRPVVHATSDAAGTFTFAAAPAGADANDSVLWASKVGFLADAHLLKASEGLAHRAWVLHAQEPIRVRVVDRDGRPVAGAAVDQFGLATTAVLRSDTAGRARRLFHRRGESDENGSTLLGLAPGSQVLVASTPTTRSTPVTIATAGEVLLRLQPTFHVGGTVSFDSWEHLNYEGERRILVEARRASAFLVLASIRDVEAGSWGPVEIPLLDGCDRYRVRLEGSPIIPTEESFASPEAGGRIELDLHGVLGHDVWFGAFDESGNLLLDAEARVWWRDPDDPATTLYNERRARPDGGIAIWSVPPGTLSYEITAPGYAPYVGDDLYVPMPVQHTIGVVLTRAGRIRGRCTYEGEPLEDFQIALWPAAVRDQRRLITFQGREDGAFEIDEAPTGAVLITASSEQLPFVEPRRVEVSPGEIVDVEFALQSGVTGRGVVVDALTDEPVPAASIQVHLAENEIRTPWGSPQPVASDGSFEIRGLIPGTNHIAVVAPGYATLWSVESAPASGVAELGTLALHRPQPLEVRLLGDSSADLEQFEIRDRGPDGTFVSYFPEDGVLRREQASAGYHWFTLSHPDEAQSSFAVELLPGQPWIVERPVTGGRGIEVQVETDDEQQRSRFALSHLMFRSQRGYFVQISRRNQSPGQPMLFEGIDAESVLVTVHDDANRELGAAEARFGSEDALVVRVPIGRPPFHVRVVDPEGSPISDVLVTVLDAGAASGVYQQTTGDDGTCRLVGVPTGPVEVMLTHDSKGARYGIPCDGSVREQEFVLSSDASIELELRDGPNSVPGITCTFLLPHRTASPRSGTTDAKGHVRFGGLSPEPYALRCAHPDYWTVEPRVEARTDWTPTEVQIRRLGDLVLQVTTAEGVPCSDVPLQLNSIEFDTSVATWIDEGRIEAQAGLRTDRRGELRLEDLPHGSYAWTVTASDSRSLEGTLVVLPAQQVRIPVVLRD